MTPDEPLHPRFLEAIHELDYTEYLVDLLIIGEGAERAALVKEIMMNRKFKQMSNKARYDREENEHE